MKILKHTHSCLLIKEQNRTILIDPGEYGYDNYKLDPTTFTKIDYILITHEHTDHMYIPFIKDILSKFPDVIILSNEEVKNKLSEEEIIVQTENTTTSKMLNKLHEKSIDNCIPKNSIFTVFDKLTHPGDNIEYPFASDIMALPIDCGLWGKVALAVERLIVLKPKYIIPIHDYRLKPEIRKDVCVRLEEHFKKFNIKFINLEIGQVVSLD